MAIEVGQDEQLFENLLHAWSLFEISISEFLIIQQVQ